jgi:hypothetical protein
MATRHKGIIAYGTEEDRQKLAVLAQLSGKSGSEIIIEMIRNRFRDILGDVDPNRIISHHDT